ncbi:hypothetical protein A2U01_0025990, partial [Trifolium medium]|nr:hypothetical protein [Trifolium medium]
KRRGKRNCSNTLPYSIDTRSNNLPELHHENCDDRQRTNVLHRRNPCHVRLATVPLRHNPQCIHPNSIP